MSIKTTLYAAALLFLGLTAVPLAARAQADTAASAVVESAPVAPPAPASAPPAAAPQPATGLLPTPLPSIASDPPAWKNLALYQKWALAPLERDWDGLDPARRSKWLEIAQRFPTLPPEEQNRMHERMRAWARLSPAERQQARLGYQVAQQIRADERRAKWEAYQALTPEQREELAEKARRKQRAPKSGSAGPESLAKSNLVPPVTKALPVKPVAPSVLQAKPGASTVLITETGIRPRHQMAGQTKVFADPELVDPKTLLPRRRGER
ncbi:DUF3106 domain-containing protein [Paucibacter sp. R3-3]|uniref:DUF3106 domain-containing protein n=1 Tax=Roseateles agri TaxID=3098619 RepID=A0ABU5DL33_9BURK|nr:DUF3106 domain-containing protein [Paucibacter sp. R3-3]MDY0747022.1 DUF3106 domain-containing protein [Paucibacter sp. R3-3]